MGHLLFRRKPPSYPWLLPTEHPLYRPFFGFSRPMNSRDYRNALAAERRRFQKEYAEYERTHAS